MYFQAASKAAPIICLLYTSGMQGTSSLSTNEDSTKDMYAVEFCGYFPTDNPKSVSYTHLDVYKRQY